LPQGEWVHFGCQTVPRESPVLRGVARQGGAAL